MQKVLKARQSPKSHLRNVGPLDEVPTGHEDDSILGVYRRLPNQEIPRPVGHARPRFSGVVASYYWYLCYYYYCRYDYLFSFSITIISTYYLSCCHRLSFVP